MKEYNEGDIFIYFATHLRFYMCFSKERVGMNPTLSLHLQLGFNFYKNQSSTMMVRHGTTYIYSIDKFGILFS